MSVEAITWALGQRVDRSSAKFVLVAMANCAGADMLCWPSIGYLVDATCQDRKTVIENLKRLRESGFILLEGHKGKTGQVAVYRLNSTENGTVKETQKRDVPKTEPVPKTDAKSPVFPREESRFSAEPVPKTGHGTVIEPSVEPSGNQKTPRAKLATPADVEPQVWADWCEQRKALKAAVTETAVAGIRREAEKAGLTLQRALEVSCERGWRGFKAEWLKDRGGGRQASVEDRNAQVMAEIFARSL